MAKEEKEILDENEEELDTTSESDENEETTEEEEVEETVPQVDSKVAALEARLAEVSRDKESVTALVQQLLAKEADVEEREDPNMDPVDRKILKLEKENKRLAQELQGISGSLFEKMDEQSIKADPELAPLYKEHKAEIEAFRNQRGQQGVYVNREEALYLVLAKKRLFTKPTTKKVVKQTIKPAGEVKKSSSVSKGKGSNESKSKSTGRKTLEELEEGLAGKKF